MNFMIFCNVEVSILWLDHGVASMKKWSEESHYSSGALCLFVHGANSNSYEYLHYFVLA
ncbi:hypothetical protein GQ55_1G283500 [Panicum hallii var. hallii]|uniref:Uncharacterized protein n=1 Tax=Panicum hallii var. hallii TaxID=1504633 RepID=A0A2T7F8E2_9POAL|nr:hypothetical protein GQ55_1G283500 [Panicum hallii var. hallii]